MLPSSFATCAGIGIGRQGANAAVNRSALRFCVLAISFSRSGERRRASRSFGFDGSKLGRSFSECNEDERRGKEGIMVGRLALRVLPGDLKLGIALEIELVRRRRLNETSLGLT